MPDKGSLPDDAVGLVGDDGRLQCDITLENANRVQVCGASLIDEATSSNVVFDLEGLSTNNSITVAIMMSWFRTAEHAGRTVAYRGVSSELRKIVEFSGLTDLLLPK